jgi:hypothetical protein
MPKGQNSNYTKKTGGYLIGRNSGGKDIVVSKAPPSPKDRAGLREWWHEILRYAGRYSCYALFLMLPSDTELIQYLIKFGPELDAISNNSCLVIMLDSTNFKPSGFDDNFLKETKDIHFFDFFKRARIKTWAKTIQNQSLRGYSVTAASTLNIHLDGFPCLVIFDDIRSANHIIVSLKDMSIEDIARKMRTIFSIINRATASNENPLVAIQNNRKNEDLLRKKRIIVSEIREFAGKTFNAIVQACIEANIK